MNLRITYLIILSLISLLSGKGLYASGYNALINVGDGFLAAGSDGRIDWFSASGNVTKSEKYPDVQLNCLLGKDQMLVAAGDKGSILLSTNSGAFRKIDSGTDKNIHSLLCF